MIYFGSLTYVGFVDSSQMYTCFYDNESPGQESKGFSFASDGEAHNNTGNQPGNSTFTSSQLLTIELNFVQKTAHMFIDNVQQPRFFGNIPPTLVPCLYSSSNTKIEFLSQETLFAPTVVNSISPNEYKIV